GIDPHVHFDTPGFTDREDFHHGSMSAAAGGVTTVIDMPCTSLPPVTNGNNFDAKTDAIEGTSFIDYAFYGGIYAGNFDRYKETMSELADKGVKGFKVYFTSGMNTYPRVTTDQFEKILAYAKELDLPVLLHAEDNEIIEAQNVKHINDPDDYLRYCRIRPEEGEITAVRNAISALRKSGGKLHIVHVASFRAAGLINKIQDELDITYETCPHYLYYTQDDFKTKGTSLKTAPVVKGGEDREMLWRFLEDGRCSFAASDHAPASLKEKETGSFESAYGGIPGVQTLIPSLFTKGFIERKISLKRMVEITSQNSAKRYGLYPLKGSLRPGSDADFAVIDTNADHTFMRDELLSKGETSPFFGEVFTAMPVMTILRGKNIYADRCGITGAAGYGTYIL
ncbi:MAG: dihydroorotase, partial [Syntrophothermus sp.]